MERTGHHSLEGVRSYKRTSDKQREALSNLLNRQVPSPSDVVVSGKPSGDHEEAASAVSSTILSTQTSQLTVIITACYLSAMLDLV